MFPHFQPTFWYFRLCVIYLRQSGPEDAGPKVPELEAAHSDVVALLPGGSDWPYMSDDVQWGPHYVLFVGFKLVDLNKVMVLLLTAQCLCFYLLVGGLRSLRSLQNEHTD